MFCPYCGREFENTGSRYCPFCGQDLADTVTFRERLSWIQMFRVLSPSEGGTKYRFLIVSGFVAIAVMLAFIVLIFVMGGNTGTTDNPELPSSDIIIEVDDSSDIILSGDFSTGSMKMYVNSSNNIMIFLEESKAEPYDRFMWVLRDEQSNTYVEISKDKGEIQWTNPRVGQFTAIVYCYLKDSDEPATSYTGPFVYRGDKNVSYTWTFNGKSFSIESTIPLADISMYTSTNAASKDARMGNDPDLFTSFITIDSAVADIQKKLSSAYSREYGAVEIGSFGYADFVLSFVQSFRYAYDSMNYNQSEYWAFPTEMLFNNCGDDEDRAILYASILRAAGYDCGLLVLPNSIVSVVHLNDVPDDISPLPGFKTSEAKYDGTTYYPADTSSDDNPHLSTIRDCYGMDNRGNVTFYGETYRGYYGIYI